MRPTFITLLPFIILGCTTLRKPGEVVNAKTGKTPDESPAYFKATGTEPFWGLNISESAIEFNFLRENVEKVSFPYREPVRAVDANVKLYASESFEGQIRAEIIHKECINEMSGEAFPYQIKLNVKLKDEGRILNGCGKYITDYRLHDIWVLEKLSGKPVTPADFQKELPNLEINADENSFMGYAGCNTMKGKLFYEKGLLRFEKVAVTKMACQAINKENEFLKALGASTAYRIANNRLFLSNHDGETLVFKKVD